MIDNVDNSILSSASGTKTSVPASISLSASNAVSHPGPTPRATSAFTTSPTPTKSGTLPGSSPSDRPRPSIRVHGGIRRVRGGGLVPALAMASDCHLRNFLTNKQRRLYCLRHGLCPHCGKSCAPYSECEARRQYVRAWRRRRGMTKGVRQWDGKPRKKKVPRDPQR